MKKLIIILALMAFVYVGHSQHTNNSRTPQKMVMKKSPDKRIANGHLLITAEVIENVRTDNNGKIIPGIELFVRRSAQDYFIKFSESGVTKEDVQKAMGKIKHNIKSLTMEVEIRHGLWDNCDGKETGQSRTGAYIVIHKLITK